MNPGQFIRRIILRHIYLLDGLIAVLGTKIKPRRGVAIIRVDEIGDFILWLPAAKRLRSIFPDSHITLIANSTWSDLAKQLPYWDNVIAINMKYFQFKKLLYRWNIIRMIASKSFAIAFQPTFSRSMPNGDSLVRATNACEKIGARGDNSNLSEQDAIVANSWYTKLVASQNCALQEIDRNFEIISLLAGIPYTSELPNLPLPDKINESVPLPPRQFVVIAPGAIWGGRRWSKENYVELIRFIKKQFDVDVIICGSPSEINLCKEIEGQESNIINLAGKTNLAQLVFILKNAQLVIGNESSPIHLANAVGTESICILGGGHFGRFLPYPPSIEGIKPIPIFEKMDCYQCNWKCTIATEFSKGAPCVQNVNLDTVKLVVKQMLLKLHTPVSQNSHFE